MIAGLQEGAQDGIALLGVLQAYALQVLEENVLRFTHGFACRRSMIVNPSLQHVGGQVWDPVLRLQLNIRDSDLANEIEFHFQVASS